MNRICVVVPVYNSKKYLNKCIRSVLKQSYKNFLLLLIDDGSTDGSGELCDKWARKDSRIKVIHQENSGSTKARNKGIELCNDDDYVTFLDSDDYLPKKALEKFISNAVLHNADIVCAPGIKVYKSFSLPQSHTPDCFKISEPAIFTGKAVMDEFFISFLGLWNLPVSLWGKLYRGSIIKKSLKFPAIVKFYGDDLCTNLRLWPFVEKLVIIPDIIYNYRVGGGTSKFNPHFLDDFLAMYRIRKSFLKTYSIRQDGNFFLDKELINIAMSWLQLCKEKGKYNNEMLENEVKRLCQTEEIRNAAENHTLLQQDSNGIRKAFLNSDSRIILNEIEQRCSGNKLKAIFKKLIS